MNNTQPNNVVPLRAKYAIFAPDLRASIETGIKPFTEKASETVNEVEQIICTHLVEVVRRGAARLAKWFGEKITNG